MTPARSTVGSTTGGAVVRLGVELRGGVGAVEPDGAGFAAVGLRAVGIAEAELRDVELKDVDLSGVELSRLELGGAELSGAEVGTEVSGVGLPSPELSGAAVITESVALAEVSGAEDSIDRVEAAAADAATVAAICDPLVDVHAAVAITISTQPATSRRHPLMRHHGRPPTGTMDP